jgi:hypothetical protein
MLGHAATTVEAVLGHRTIYQIIYNSLYKTVITKFFPS